MILFRMGYINYTFFEWSLEEEITSLLFFSGDKGKNLLVRLTAGDQKSRIDHVKAPLGLH